MIKLLNVSFSYNGKEIFKNINLEIKEGEWIALVGANGSGKSTLIKLLNGILIPNEGQVLIDDLNTKEEKAIWEIRKRVGVVFQNPDTQIVASIVEDDIAFGPENLGLPPDEIKDRVEQVLNILELTDFRFSPTYALSGGQKQKLAIAGILAMKPKYLVLDEPTSMLDPPSRKDINKILKFLYNKEKITVIYSTHNPEEVILANRVIALFKGSIVFDGKPEEFFLEPERVWNYGVKIPIITYLCYKLKQRGLKVNFPIFEPKELSEELWRLKLKT
ncbi:MAG: energy-coupling factor transporter ATPase [Synergistetes bacterium]|nr:energy-coupling factor transporter ATPase [Synergistota bacterium]MCX8128100.1 energy-coupling factor transporter ATPase [Synergistota bacterium]MDW8192476.1 energy-coupling factor transporter ATPase [Synergistota bacterium]